MKDSFHAYAYSIATLENLLIEYSETTQDILNSKLHLIYFEEYFKEIKAKIILVETNYIDRDFLDDYAGYYVKCFHCYEHRCTRLHFFDIAFDENEFYNLLVGKGLLSIKKLQQSYLGFIVIKPLPQTIIGRTCLKTYPTENALRYYPIIRNYSINLYGIELSVKSLAYQEQDHVVAACATSALWSAFQGTGMLFQHRIPSPVEITKLAVELMPMETRSIPNNGLTFYQMAHAIRKMGLEPVLINAPSYFILKSTVYAYLKGGIPLIAGFSLYDTSLNPPKFLGRHAVAVTGYRISESSLRSAEEIDFQASAMQMSKIYVHDDQVGPYARMEFDDAPIKIGTKEMDSLLTSWPDANGALGNVRATDFALLVPIYHKIRIPFELVEQAIIEFDAFIQKLQEKGLFVFSNKVKWDIHLSTVNEYKGKIYNTAMDPELKKAILVSPFPRFLWIATAYHQEEILADLLFDATDIDQGNFFLRTVSFDKQFEYLLKRISKQEKLINLFVYSLSVKNILSWYAEQ